MKINIARADIRPLPSLLRDFFSALLLVAFTFASVAASAEQVLDLRDPAPGGGASPPATLAPAEPIPDQPEPVEVVFAVFAYLGLDRTRAKYQPLEDYLNATLRHERVRVEVLTEPELMARIHAGTVDIVTTNPTHFLVARKSRQLGGAMATLVQNHEGRPLHRLGGAIVTHTSRSDIRDLRDLRGKVIAAPSMAHMGGYRAQAYEAYLAGVRLPGDAREVLELGTHLQALQALLDGTADIAFVRDGILELAIREGQIQPGQLKVINAQYHPDFPFVISTRLYPEWPVFALPHVDERIVRHIAAALFNIEPNDPFAVAAGIYGYTTPADYLVVEDLARGLRLPPFDRAPDFTLADAWERWGLLLSGFLIALLVISILLGILVQVLRRENRERQRFHSLLSALGEGLFEVDRQGRCTFINQEALRLLGLRSVDALGRNRHELFHHHYPDGQAYPESDCPIAQTLADGVPRRAQEWFLRRGGAGFPVDTVINPLLQDGKIAGAVVAFQDISVRLEMQKQRDALAERNRLLLDSAGDGIYGCDLNGRCTFINPMALKMLGYEQEEVLGYDQHAIFHYRRSNGDAYPPIECPIHQTVHDGQVRACEDAFIRKDGRMFPVHMRVTPLCEQGRRVGAVVVFQDITERRQLQDRLLELASTDGLTGLHNRRHFMERLQSELHRIRRSRRSAALLMLDLDFFKAINDRYGHAAGDTVLRFFAELLRSNARQSDLVARLGGEEFAVLLPDCDLNAAAIFAERLRGSLALAEIPYAERLLQVTVSIGCTDLGPDDSNPEICLSRADDALYRAKASGRNCIRLGPGPFAVDSITDLHQSNRPAPVTH